MHDRSRLDWTVFSFGPRSPPDDTADVSFFSDAMDIITVQDVVAIRIGNERQAVPSGDTVKVSSSSVPRKTERKQTRESGRRLTPATGVLCGAL